MLIAVVSDLFPTHNPPTHLIPDSMVFVPQQMVPTVEQLAPFDLIVILGRIIEADRAIELSGALDHLLLNGKTVALLYLVRLDDPGLSAIIRRFLPAGWSSIASGVPVRATVPAWDDYFRRYGTSASYFGNTDARTVAVMASQPAQAPAQLESSVGAGALYVLPFHVGDPENSRVSQENVVRAVGEAIMAERAGFLPVEYLADLRLPNEEQVLEAIGQLEKDLAAQHEEALRLYRYRLLLGPASGDSLEELVRDALCVILEPTGLRVEDRPERFGEDFWIIGPNGDVALGEVKGINSGVGRKEINQVDDHREELGHDTGELPGILVVNVYRKDGDLSRKVDERVHPNIVAALRRQNVTLLRTADLYRLLGRRLRDEDAGEILVNALTSGGGWVEVTDDQVTLHGDD